VGEAIPALEADPSVVRQNRGPTLDVGGGVKAHVRRGGGGSLVDGAQCCLLSDRASRMPAGTQRGEENVRTYQGAHGREVTDDAEQGAQQLGLAGQSVHHGPS
jgi:hypothetical protein